MYQQTKTLLPTLTHGNQLSKLYYYATWMLQNNLNSQIWRNKFKYVLILTVSDYIRYIHFSTTLLCKCITSTRTILSDKEGREKFVVNVGCSIMIIHFRDCIKKKSNFRKLFSKVAIILLRLQVHHLKPLLH